MTQASDRVSIESPAVPALEGDQHDGLQDHQEDVLRLWLSSMRAPYRRAVRGRSSLMPFSYVTARGRHAAPR